MTTFPARDGGSQSRVSGHDGAAVVGPDSARPSRTALPSPWTRVGALLPAFWFAYVVTRPLGASFSDFVGKPTNLSGLGRGDGRTALVLLAAIVLLVAFLSITRRDEQRESHGVGAPW